VRLELLRPAARFCNDPVPLTICVEGNADGSIVSASCASAEILPSRRVIPGVGMLNVAHDKTQSLPLRIDHIPNPGNEVNMTSACASADFPGLRGLLHADGDSLVLKLRNGTGKPVSGLKVTYRTALAWKEGVVMRDAGALPDGASFSDRLALTRATDDPKYHCGNGYFVAQLDFVLGDEPARLYLTCRRPEAADTSAYPSGRFAVLGPVPQQFADELTTSMARTGGTDPRWKAPDGTVFAWRAGACDGETALRDYDAEVIPTQGAALATDFPVYCAQAVVSSRREQNVRFHCLKDCIPLMMLNGERVHDFKGSLRKGENRLLLVYRVPGMQAWGKHMGCHLRIVDAQNGQRVEDISYSVP
jgi:hypothetical protein